jgi:hypothetical protein
MLLLLLCYYYYIIIIIIKLSLALSLNSFFVKVIPVIKQLID